MRYIIWNGTDSITATPDTYTSKKKAQEKIDNLREMFRSIQGYYRDNKGNKVAPDDIEYLIVPVQVGETVLSTAVKQFAKREKV